MQSLKHVVITGASSGIGQALAEHYAVAGNRLGLIARNTERLAAVVASTATRADAVESAQADVTDRPAIESVLRRFDAEAPIDLLIVNAGILGGRRKEEAIETGEMARRVIATNLIGAIDCFQAVLPAMQARDRGQIAFISSLSAFAPLADAPAYAASKAALLSYGLAMREALAPTGIAVNVVTPGYVASAMTDSHRGAQPFKISADKAARIIGRGLARNAAIIGFPTPFYQVSRLSLLLPDRLRQLGSKGLRFHVADLGT